MSDPKPMSLLAFAKLWHCEAEFEKERPDATHWWVVWEPLDTDAPEDARPYCYGIGEIDFYDRTGNRHLDRRVRCHDLTAPHPMLVLLKDGVWREVLSGKVVYRNGRWHMRWLCATNTRAAMMMNAGFAEYRA